MRIENKNFASKSEIEFENWYRKSKTKIELENEIKNKILMEN